MAARHPTSTRSNVSGPPSPTMSAHTTATNIGLPFTRLPAQLINRTDLRNSLSAYETLLTASKAYTQALIALGSASSELAVALESCSRLKGAHKVGSGVLAASGVHHMASNSWSILADTFWKDTSIPLMEHHDLYVQACTERTIQHEKAITQKSRLLNEAERKNQKESRSKVGRDLHSFRRALLELQKHVDDLDEEKARYYADVLEGEEECWAFVQDKITTSLRSQLDMFERISSKGMSDPVLEPLLSNIPDPFSAYGPPRNDDQIFSILNHGSLLGLTSSPGLNEGSADHTAGEGEDQTAEPHAEQNPITPANLIMSPSTPSKGLSRVASGAASPKQNGEVSSALNGTSNAGEESTKPAIATTSSAGLGISLAAAVDLARQSKTSPQTKVQTSNVVSDNNAELFGTDGEDDGGDEASIFSGTEDDGEGLGLTDENSATKPSVGMAARIMQEKKRRRENAVRANAKTRLKHALSTIDESKGNTSQTGHSTLSSSTTIPSSEGDKSQSQQSSILGERDINIGNSSKDGPLEKNDVKEQNSSSDQNSNRVIQHDVDSVWT